MLNTTVMWLTMRQLFVKRRLLLAIAFSFVPLVFTFFFRFNADDRVGVIAEFFSALNRNLIIGTLVPLAAVVFGTTAFGGEVDDGTLVYLLTKPVSRASVMLSKYVVAVGSTMLFAIACITLPWLVVQGTEVTSDMLVGFLAGALLASAIYCAMFLVMGLMTKRALVLSLVYVIAFEGVMSRQIVGLKSLSVREFAVATSLAASRKSLQFVDPVVSMQTVWIMGGIFFIGSLAFCLRQLSRYEVAERV